MRAPSYAHGVKLEKKQSYGPVTAYRFSFSEYDADLAWGCAAAMLAQVDPGGKILRLGEDGIPYDCTDDHQAEIGTFRTLQVAVRVNGRQPRMIPGAGMNSVAVEAGTAISESVVTLLTDRAAAGSMRRQLPVYRDLHFRGGP